MAACGSEAANDDSFGSGRPSTTEPTSSISTTPETVPDTTADPAPLAEPSVSLLEVGRFDRPVDVAVRPDAGELYIVEQPGRVVAVTDLSTAVALDISDLTGASGERGLLGLAFHPTADLAYVNFTDANGDTVIAEFAVDPATGGFDRATFREVLTVDQPYSNHNGGQLAFGPDELLYIGVGDGGSGGDPERYALDLTSRLGKMLRIDPVAAGAEPFAVPVDNPFADDPAADPTIWAYGLRNPWRFSFDADTGDLWIGDVGQGVFEEINRSVATEGRDAARGANFGWSALEGFERFNQDQPADGTELPLFVYDHANGRCSVTGGTLARGDLVADLAGWYVFGDYCSGQIWALDPGAPPSEPRVVQIAELDSLVALAAGPDRELYAVSNGGTVARLVTG
jgi:glucose/arabinose dehydrogenase